MQYVFATDLYGRSHDHITTSFTSCPSLHYWPIWQVTRPHRSLLVPPCIPIITSLLLASNSGVSKGEREMSRSSPLCTQFRASTYHCTATWRLRKKDGRGGPRGSPKCALFTDLSLCRRWSSNIKRRRRRKEIPRSDTVTQGHVLVLGMLLFELLSRPATMIYYVAVHQGSWEGVVSFPDPPPLL